ncbi:MAG: cation:proton antiporter [Candidatus Margulisbacteria bacterium]|nr:cation:proton antiporter [Candidatus Margulisiibacteriota bacterium]
MNPLSAMVFFLSLTALVCLMRVFIGPTPFDRLIGLNLLVLNITVIIATLAVEFERHVYFDVALVYAILGYVSVIAISKYLTGRELHK